MSVLLPLVVIAAAALAYYGYRYAEQMASRGVRYIQQSTNDLASEKIGQVERVLLESQQTLFDIVNPANLQELDRRRPDIARMSAVESIIVVDDRLQIAPDGFVSKKRKTDAEAFRELLVTRIIPRLGLGQLAEGEEGHVHQEVDGRYYLLSFTRKSAGGRIFYVVLEHDLVYVVGELLPDHFRNVDRSLYQVVDERGDLVFGQPFTGVPREYQVTRPFGRTLTAWRLRMAPREAAALRAKESERRAYDWFFILLSAVVMFVGLGLIALAVRTERRASDLKSDFIANVSHELKTPLSLIRMFAELLASGRTRGEASEREYAQIIQRESERLTRLIDNVLDFARLERGKAAYSFRRGDLAEVVQRGLEVYRYRLDRQGMKLALEVEPGLPGVLLDENAMTLVLLNLVDNAVKYAAEGKELRISVGHDPRARRVVLRVSDRGPGICEDDRRRVFERFFRAPTVRGKRVRGSGIGLALVKHIAQAHHGGVEVASKLGEGSTFSVWLPVASGAPAGADDEPAGDAGPPDDANRGIVAEGPG
jgi:two-component system phosphate regulon sensor histidine kinase PhoR